MEGRAEPRGRYDGVAGRLAFLLAVSATSLLVVAAALPDLLLRRRRSFTWQHDTEIPYQNVFTLVSHWSHGLIQLWNPYDQMNYAYTQLTVGLYTVANVVTAAAYLTIAPFVTYPGAAFHDVFTIGYHAVALALRTGGGYLLLTRVTRRPLVVFLSLLSLNTLLSSQMYGGLLANSLYSLLPLLLYFVVRFFEEFTLTPVLGAVIVMTVAVAGSPLLGLGYFYQVVHFFIVAALIVTTPRAWRRRGDLGPALRAGLTRGNALRVVVTAAVCVVVMAPWLRLLRSLQSDFFIFGSGLGETHGRLEKVFRPSRYFEGPSTAYAPVEDFVSRSLDFWHNDWFATWTFLGVSTLILSVLAVVLSRRAIKQPFALAIAFVIAANAPRDPTAVAGLVHWMNALTNPFSFLVRGFHMTALLMPYLFLPLVALGLEVCLDLVAGRLERLHAERLPLGRLLGLGALGGLALTVPYPARDYGIFVTLLALTFLTLATRSVARGAGTPARVMVVLLVVAGTADLLAFGIYVRHETYGAREIAPRTISGVDVLAPLVLDYQNPGILPRREYYRADPEPLEPRIYSHQNHYGLLYHYTPIGRYFRRPSLYEPRPLAYRGLDDDPDVRRYLARDGRMMFFAAAAVRRGATTLGALVDRGLDRRIVILEAPPGLAGIAETVPPDIGAAPLPPPSGSRVTFGLADGRPARTTTAGTEYLFPLPAGWPRDLATTVFTADRSGLRLALDGRPLEAVQGSLVAPYTFDVGNAATGALAVLLPREGISANPSLVLESTRRSDVTTVWRNEFDAAGFDYRAPRDGWLVLHVPFDDKWRITIDGRERPVLRANGYFVGVPVAAGDHRVLVEYWPDTWLRPMIAASVGVGLAALAAVAAAALHHETHVPPDSVV